MKEIKESAEGTTNEARCTRSFAEREGATLAAVCTGMTSADIAQKVQTLAPGYFRDGPVVDASGLKGVYDFKLEWITNGEANAGKLRPDDVRGRSKSAWLEAGEASAIRRYVGDR